MANQQSLIVLPVLIINFFVCNAIICYKCDSIAVEACSMSLDGTDMPYEECRLAIDCVMSIVDGVTYRGCNGDTPTIGAAYKKYCDQNLCNKGVYPPGRLKCYHCNGAECNEKPSGKPRPCREHHEYDECYTDVIDVNDAYRGCKSDRNYTTTDKAEFCDINACNDQVGASILKCAQCDSVVDRGCKMDLFEVNKADCNITQYETCEVHSLLTQQETCFLYYKLDRVVRGCTKYIPEEIKGDEPNRMECHDNDYCNAGCLHQQKCLVCDSSNNDTCRSNSTAVSSSICASPEVSSCYAYEYNNWHMKRGCSVLPNAENINRHYECDRTDGCNVVSFTRCYNCSSDINSSCASWDRPGYVDIEECTIPGAKCIAATLADGGATVRGCESDELHCNNNTLVTSCQTCNVSFCNDNPFPPSRLRCYQCQGTANCIAAIESDPLPCAPVPLEPIDAKEACFEYYDMAQGMMRGCRSNTQLYYSCLLESTDNSCRICFDNGCNRSPAMRPPVLLCYQCDRFDQNCQMDQINTNDLKRCEHSVPFNYEESCFVTRHLDGNATRGCTLDQLNVTKVTPWDQISYCTENACNSLATIAQYCVSCEANLQKDQNSNDEIDNICLSQTHRLQPRLCGHSAGQCFSLIEDSHLLRGCANEIPDSHKDSCSNRPMQSTSCVMCHNVVCDLNDSLKSIIRNYGNGAKNDFSKLITFYALFSMYSIKFFI